MVAMAQGPAMFAPIYHYNDTSSPGQWTQVGSDIIDGESAEDRSGHSVNWTIGGYKNVGNGSNSGHVRIYYTYNDTSSPGQWTQVGSDIDGESASDISGWSVSLSSDGRTVAIGAPHNGGNGLHSGHVRCVYHYNDTSSPGQWTQVGSDIDGESAGDLSGYSVSLSSDGRTVAIGAPHNGGNGSYSGHVRVYHYNDTSSPGQWTRLGSDIDGEIANYSSGHSVSLSSDGRTVLAMIGAPQNNGNGTRSGHVRVYHYNDTSSPGQWTQVGSDIDGESAEDRSGHSVSLSSDGKIVAVGGYKNDGNGTDSGHVRVYHHYNDTSSPGQWTQVGSDIDGESASDDSGNSVSLSSDGRTVAIGAPWNDDNGSYSGHVRVFNIGGI